MNKPKNQLQRIFSTRSFATETFKSMEQICSPTLHKIGVSAFEYARVYDDKSALILYSDPKIATYVVDHEYHITAHAPPEIIKDEFWHTPTPCGGYAQGLNDIRDFSGSSSCINYIRRYQGFYEMFCFWSTEEQNIAASKFFNAKETLEQYTSHFLEQAKSLIEDADKERFILTEAMLPNFQGLDSKPHPNTKFHFYIKKAQQELIKLNAHLPTPLSIQELKCISALLEGKTAADIAELIHLSPRTIEMHINSAKIKLECRKKSDIIATLVDLSEKIEK